jgi:uncharacterized integral membrane protein
MKRAKMIVAAVIAVLVIIVVFQNLERAEPQLLFVTLPMPRAVLLIVTYLVGLISGLLLASSMAKKKPKR